jgi:hypothetical protein
LHRAAADLALPALVGLTVVAQAQRDSRHELTQ